MKRSLPDMAAVAVAVLLAGILPPLASAPASPIAAPVASVMPSLSEAPVNAVVTTGKVTQLGAAQRTRAMLRGAEAPTRLYLRPEVAMAQGMAPRLVSSSVRVSIRKCYNRTRNVWLTFDDGYTSQANLNSILNTLKTYNVRGRFFLVGSWARTHPSMVRQIKAAGHFVENHTSTHRNLNKISNAAVSREIANGLAASSAPKLLRPPYGEGVYTNRLYNLALQQGYRLCFWGSDTRDWTGASASVIVNRVVRGDRWSPPVRAGESVVMHLKNTQARNALPRIIRALRAKGLTFEKLR